jgi:ribosomal protein S21
MTTTDVRHVRPGPLRWIWYALGGGLPARFSPWVLHDTTTGTWALRHVLRALVQLAVPIALVLLLVPGEFWIRGMAALGGLLLALFFSVAYMVESTESRVKRAGFPAGTAQKVRDRSHAEREVRERERRQAAAARRTARYRARQER